MIAEGLATLSLRINIRLWIRLFLIISTLYGFWVGFNLNEYQRWQARFLDGVFWTSVAHFGLWLATFEVRSRLRFLVAPAFLLSLVGVVVLWDHLNSLMAIAALGGASWLIFRFLKGKFLAN